MNKTIPDRTIPELDEYQSSIMMLKPTNKQKTWTRAQLAALGNFQKSNSHRKILQLEHHIYLKDNLLSAPDYIKKRKYFWYNLVLPMGLIGNIIIHPFLANVIRISGCHNTQFTFVLVYTTLSLTHTLSLSLTLSLSFSHSIYIYIYSK